MITKTRTAIDQVAADTIANPAGRGCMVQKSRDAADIGRTLTPTEAGRLYAAWHLGDPDWYDLLVNAAANPDETSAAVRAAAGV